MRKVILTMTCQTCCGQGCTHCYGGVIQVERQIDLRYIAAQGREIARLQRFQNGVQIEEKA